MGTRVLRFRVSVARYAKRIRIQSAQRKTDTYPVCATQTGYTKRIGSGGKRSAQKADRVENEKRKTKNENEQRTTNNEQRKTKNEKRKTINNKQWTLTIKITINNKQ